MGATDGEIGKVKEFYFDDESWVVRYLIVDSHCSRCFGQQNIFCNLTKEQIKNSPDINTELPVSRQEEIKLQKYYPWIQYWGGGYYGGGSGVSAISPGPLAWVCQQLNLPKKKSNKKRILISTYAAQRKLLVITLKRLTEKLVTLKIYT